MEVYQKIANREIVFENTTGPRLQNIICAVTSDGFVYCITERDLIRRYVDGHWDSTGNWNQDIFEIGKAYAILEKINKINSTLFSEPGNTLVHCANNKWYQTDTFGQIGLVKASSTSDSKLPSVFEMYGMHKGCKVLEKDSGLGGNPLGSPGGLGNGRSGMTQNTIDKIDREMDECRDGGGQSGLYNAGKVIVNGLKGKAKLTPFSLAYWALFELDPTAETLTFMYREYAPKAEAKAATAEAIADYDNNAAMALEHEVSYAEGELTSLKQQLADETDPTKKAELNETKKIMHL